MRRASVEKLHDGLDHPLGELFDRQELTSQARGGGHRRRFAPAADDLLLELSDAGPQGREALVTGHA